MALAGHQHHVVGAGHADRLGDRARAVAQDDRAGAVGEAGDDVGDDRVAILAARIVVGDDRDIGAALGDRRHLRALAAVALAAAAEHADQLAGGKRTQRAQRLFQRVRGVRVVDDHQRQPALAAEPAHAAIDRRQLRQGLGHQRRGHAQRDQGGRHPEQVVDVEAAQQRRAHRMRLVAGVQHETDPAGVEPDLLRTHAGTGGAARGEAEHAHPATDRLEQFTAEAIVEVDGGRAQAGPVDQARGGRG